MAFFKTLVNVGKNICNDFTVPVTRSVEKDKEKGYEVRIYEKNKYIVFKYRTMDKRTATESSNKDKPKPNDKVMDNIWKLMKYTQGENDQNKTMKLYMPVFIYIETLTKDKESKVESENVAPNGGDEEEVEVRLMITLPPEYQYDPKNPDKEVLEPPKPNDETVFFETHEEFKCYVRYKYI